MKSLSAIALVFLKISFTAFGGHAAHLAMMEEEVVRRRKWITHEEFLDIISAANLIPGPNSTETALHIGYSLAGWGGFFTAGLCFISPTILIVTAVAMAYVKYGNLPATESILFFVKPVVMAVIALAIYRFSKTAIKNKLLLIFFLVAIAGALFKLTEIFVILLVGFLCMLISLFQRGLLPNLKELFQKNNLHSLPLGMGSFIFEKSLYANSCVTQCDLPAIFLFFFKVSAIIFGSGYVLYAFLYNDLVINYQWITQAQLIDAIAIGQFTPGPVFTAATFIGYLLAGTPGALLASLGAFLPAFIYVAITSPFLSQMRKSKALGFFLDGVNVASLALMVVVCFSLAQNILMNIWSVIVFSVTLGLLMRFRFNSAWLVLVSIVLGLLIPIC